VGVDRADWPPFLGAAWAAVAARLASDNAITARHTLCWGGRFRAQHGDTQATGAIDIGWRYYRNPFRWGGCLANQGYTRSADAAGKVEQPVDQMVEGLLLVGV